MPSNSKVWTTRSGQHLAYTRLLFDQGKIVLGDAATDGAIGVIVWRVESAKEMQRIHDAGLPFVSTLQKRLKYDYR